MAAGAARRADHRQGFDVRACSAPGSLHHVRQALTSLTGTLSPGGRAFSIACGPIHIGNATTDSAVALLRAMPEPDGAMRGEIVMDAGHVARSVLYLAGLLRQATLRFMTERATAMPVIGRR